MDHDAIWRAEERLWLEGPEAFRALLDPQCLMAFPAPVGLLEGAAILRTLEGAPRWATIDMTERVLVMPDPSVAVIGYRAKAARQGSEPYSAYCSSTYRLAAGDWRLIQHQQTPLG